MKYNRSLDLVAAAGVYSLKGQVNSAAKAFTAAVKDPSFTAALKIIEASNRAAYKAAVKAGTIKANSEGVESDNPGEELRVEVEENGERNVQESRLRAQAKRLTQKADALKAKKAPVKAEAEAGDDAEEEDDGFDMECGTDEADSDLAFLDGADKTASSDDEGDMSEEEIDGEPTEELSGPEAASFIKAFGQRVKSTTRSPKKTTASSFARAVRNMNALNA